MTKVISIFTRKQIPTRTISVWDSREYWEHPIYSSVVSLTSSEDPINPSDFPKSCCHKFIKGNILSDICEHGFQFIRTYMNQ